MCNETMRRGLCIQAIQDPVEKPILGAGVRRHKLTSSRMHLVERRKHRLPVSLSLRKAYQKAALVRVPQRAMDGASCHSRIYPSKPPAT
jgi:hypothetical protein